jgi:PKHD-type hydroxylase
MLPILGILEPNEVEEIRTRLAATAFSNSNFNRTWRFADVKNHHQADQSDCTDELQRLVQDALLANFQFKIYAWPSKWARMGFSRYGPDEYYGRHVDGWTQRNHEGEMIRRDLSFTLFLNEPDSYEGGELVLERLDGPVSIKLPAGSIFIYSTGIVHQVMPVRSGERHVCVGWIESRLRSEEHRNLVYELSLVHANTPKGELNLLLDKGISTLMRMWADM